MLASVKLATILNLKPETKNFFILTSDLGKFED
jgi:hypothetical protein